MADPDREFLSVIMPALNEEKNIEKAIRTSLQAMDDLKIRGEVLVINDGSTDQTEPLTRRLMQNEARIRLLRHETPQGIGASFWNGVAEAGGTVVTMFPGDNENDPYEALRYFDLLKQVDVIIPFIYNKEARGALRVMISFLFRTIINVSFGLNLNYTNGTVLYRKSLLSDLDLQSKGFLYQTEILVKVIRRGYLFAEVPCSLGKRVSGVSKAMTLRSLVNVIKSYLRLIKSVYWEKSGSSGSLRQNSATFRRVEVSTNGKVSPGRA